MKGEGLYYNVQGNGHNYQKNPHDYQTSFSSISIISPLNEAKHSWQSHMVRSLSKDTESFSQSSHILFPFNCALLPKAHHIAMFICLGGFYSVLPLSLFHYSVIDVDAIAIPYGTDIAFTIQIDSKEVKGTNSLFTHSHSFTSDQPHTLRVHPRSRSCQAKTGVTGE
jgi:hypothetical protein